MRFPLRFFPDKTHIDFMRLRWMWFILSLALVAATVFFLFTRGLNLGIDFTGGLLMEVRTEKEADLHAMREALGKGGFGEVSLQRFGDSHQALIRVQPRGEATQAEVVAKVKRLLAGVPGGVEYRKTEYVGPTIGAELIENGVWALVISLGGIMLYVWFRFEWQFGVGVILALIHDAVATMGFFIFTQYEFGMTSIAALLTIVGYSVNDSVVIYDRIRENLRKYKKMPVYDIINLSLNETLSRSILTHGTTSLAALALLLFGGPTLESLSASFLFGVFAGVYSSLYISAPVLIYFGVRAEDGEEATAGAAA